MAVDNDEEAAKQQTIDDKYSKPIKPLNDSDVEEKRDEMTIKRENFLSIYKEKTDGGDDNTDEPDLSNGIRFKRDQNEDDTEFQMKTGTVVDPGKKPLIQEIDAKTSAEIAERKKEREIAEAEVEREFSFDSAERVELKGSFI